jgi:hypothetical protein
MIPEVVEIEKHAQDSAYYFTGRPLEDRCSIARAFIAKAVYDLPNTKDTYRPSSQCAPIKKDMWICKKMQYSI